MTSRSLAVPALLAVTAAASLLFPDRLAGQNDYPFRKVQSATFGKSMQLSLSGMPQNKILLFMLSTTGGPTPLQSLIGQDTRSLEVGTELLPLWLYLNSGNGSLNLGFPTPTLASLQGLPIHLQTMTGPGAGTQLVDRISNKVVIVPGASGSSALLAAKLRVARGLMSVLPNKNISSSGGDVLLAGGGTGSILGAVGLKTTDRFDYHRMAIQAGPDLTVERALHTATILKDGRVLLAGGVDKLGATQATAEIYDPTTNKFAATGSLNTKRAGHEAALLKDGRVLVVGGTSDLSTVTNYVFAGNLGSAEIYDPTSGKWTAAASAPKALLAPALTTLADGRVLLTGGVEITTLFSIPFSLQTVKNAAVYDPTGNKWTGVAGMAVSRAAHGINTILLADGRVLVTGGTTASISLVPPPTTLAGVKAIADAEFYDPTRNQWTSLANMASARTGHTVTQLADGRVFVVGGASGSVDLPVPLGSVQALDTTNNQWAARNDLQVPRTGHGAYQAPDGLLVIFGGQGGTQNITLDTIEVIHP